MEKEFDFNQVGKRMPYKVPNGFFDSMEAGVWAEIGRKPAVVAHRNRRRWRITAAALAVAASVALLLVLHPFAPDKPQYGFATVEQAFANLSLDDQAYMLEVYQEDIFMDE